MALLIGDATTSYSNADTNEGGSIEAWLFTASASGTVDTLMFRTAAAADAGVTSLVLGIYADNGSGTSPTGSPLGTATVSGTPPANTWVTTAASLSVAVTAGVKYWLAHLPLPAGSGALIRMNEAAASGGTNVMASTTNGNSSLGAPTWQGPFAVGPAGFQATGTATGGADLNVNLIN